jgi:hypothetical protein
MQPRDGPSTTSHTGPGVRALLHTTMPAPAPGWQGRRARPGAGWLGDRPRSTGPEMTALRDFAGHRRHQALGT